MQPIKKKKKHLWKEQQIEITEGLKFEDEKAREHRTILSILHRE